MCKRLVFLRHFVPLPPQTVRRLPQSLHAATCSTGVDHRLPAAPPSSTIAHDPHPSLRAQRKHRDMVSSKRRKGALCRARNACTPHIFYTSPALPAVPAKVQNQGVKRQGLCFASRHSLHPYFVSAQSFAIVELTSLPSLCVPCVVPFRT